MEGALAFSSARAAHDGKAVTFTLDDVEFTCTHELAGIALLDLAAAASEDVATVRGVAALRQFLRAALKDEREWLRFQEHTLKHNTSPLVLFEIMSEVMPKVIGHPTGRPSASADGPSPTGPTSRVVSFSRGTVEEVPVSSASPGVS